MIEDGAREEEDSEPQKAALEERGLALLANRRRLVTVALGLIALIVAIYVLFPAVVGLDDALARVGDATWY